MKKNLDLNFSMLRKVTLLGFIGLFLSIPSLAQVIPIKEVFAPKGNFPKPAWVKVAVVAISPIGNAPVPSTPDEAEDYKQQNREALAAQIREAAENGAEMIITPEFGVTGYPDIASLPSEEDEFRNRKEIEPFIEATNGITANYFSKLAKELKVYLHIGLATGASLESPYYNTVLVFDPEGKVIITYDKVELYQLEHQFLSPGTKIAIYDSPVGRVGLIICADVYSQKVLPKYHGKVDVLALSTSWARYNSGMNSFRIAAANLGVYLLAANQTYFPDSGVINPDGTIQSHIRQSDGVAYGFLPRKVKGK